MTDHDLLAYAYGDLRLAANLLIQEKLTHTDIVRARNLTQEALAHLQGLENRFRQNLITTTPSNEPDTSPASPS